MKRLSGLVSDGCTLRSPPVSYGVRVETDRGDERRGAPLCVDGPEATVRTLHYRARRYEGRQLYRGIMDKKPGSPAVNGLITALAQCPTALARDNCMLTLGAVEVIDCPRE
ncbi:hypothetical protein BURKHO8Y_60046 [Burkholderia sp. 8Y]|nr:hypothetical protein BURKHO8Y_60046 [Burkholderia sp. 8Y]